jgi:hypothetical protein
MSTSLDMICNTLQMNSIRFRVEDDCVYFRVNHNSRWKFDCTPGDFALLSVYIARPENVEPVDFAVEGVNSKEFQPQITNNGAIFQSLRPCYAMGDVIDNYNTAYTLLCGKSGDVETSANIPGAVVCGCAAY